MSAKNTGWDKNSICGSILQFLARFPSESFKSRELSRRIGIHSQKEYDLFKKALRSLQDEHKILRIKGKKYGFLHEKKFVIGRLEITPRGFGIVTGEKEGEEVFIRREDMEGALQGDIVETSLFAQSTKQKEKGARPEGEIIRIVSRSPRLYVGTLERVKKQYFIVPNDKKLSGEILVAQNDLHGANVGDKVSVEIAGDAKLNKRPYAHVVEVMGRPGEMGAEIRSVMCKYNLPADFPKEVGDEVRTIPDVIPESEINHRLDLRGSLCFTIDPEDAKDFDDAISLEPLPDGSYELGVHIADVSCYVRAGGAIDKEALKRSTSVYFPNGVIPMLPEKLSSGLCSLRPNEDRLTFSVLINISPQGIVKNYKIIESVIHSKRRFTYEEVQSLLNAINKNEPAPFEDKRIMEVLKRMYLLSTALTRKRMKEGSIDFDSPEARFEFDAEGKPVKIIKKVRMESNRLVEEFMLLANQVVATHIGLARKEEHPKPFLYRVHDSPDPERINELAVFVKKMGFGLNIDNGVTSKALQSLLEKVRGTEVENIINEVVLRSMSKAVYSERNIGHYGLAFDYYSHFTSPIRRYPDLVVHRLLKRYAKGVPFEEQERIKNQLPYIAKQSSEMERAAMEAERAAVKVMQVEYMKQHVGDEFHAVISGVTNYGMFVELTDLLVQGMIHVRELESDYFIYDDKEYALKGRRTGKMYRLGDPVEVRAIRVVPEDQMVDFNLIEKNTEKNDYPGRKKPAAKRRTRS